MEVSRADLGGVPSRAAAGAPERLKKAATEFESVMIAHMLKEAQPKGDLLGKSFAAGTFQDMYTDLLSRTIAEQQPFGLADAMVKAVQARDKGATDATNAPSGSGAGQGQ